MNTKEKAQKEKANTEGQDAVIETGDITKIQVNIQKNLEYIMKTNRIEKRKDLAVKLGVTAPQLTRIMNGEQLPTLNPFLLMLKKHSKEFGCTVDEFLFTDLEEEAAREREKNGAMVDLPIASYMKFAGLFQGYYYDTSSFKGRERSKDQDALKSGLIYIYNEPGAKDEKKQYVTAVLNMKKEDADRHYKEALRANRLKGTDIKSYITALGGSSHVYYGEMEHSLMHMYISLRYEGLKDKVQMIFHRPSSSSEQYIGGLGAMISVSKGPGAAPCVQCIGISETSLDASAEEIASQLLMQYPNIKTYESEDELAGMLIQLYHDEEGKSSRLSDEQKKILVRSHMDKIVNETVERNLFRTVVVSAVDDNEFYHYLKRIRKNMRQEGWS